MKVYLVIHCETGMKLRIVYASLDRNKAYFYAEKFPEVEDYAFTYVESVKLDEDVEVLLDA